MRKKKSFVIIAACLLVAQLVGVSVLAQERQRAKVLPDGGVWIQKSEDAQGNPERERGIVAFKMLSSDMRFGESIVKGAPYSAKAVIEQSQTLADGTQINHSSSILLYRDSEGRTRRDETFGAIGPIGPNMAPSRVIFINDTVTSTHYFLDPGNQTARKITLPDDGPPPGMAMPRFEMRTRMHGPGPQGPGPSTDAVPDGVGPASAPEEKTESLGTQNIEGVEAEGTRTTITIPTGQIGNDRPIEIVDEQWYSSALQTIVLSKHKDPRVGEHTYRLTNISRAEPDHSLFEVPSTYKVEEPDGLMIRQRKQMRDSKSQDN